MPGDQRALLDIGETNAYFPQEVVTLTRVLKCKRERFGRRQRRCYCSETVMPSPITNTTPDWRRHCFALGRGVQTMAVPGSTPAIVLGDLAQSAANAGEKEAGDLDLRRSHDQSSVDGRERCSDRSIGCFGSCPRPVTVARGTFLARIDCDAGACDAGQVGLRWTDDFTRRRRGRCPQSFLMYRQALLVFTLPSRFSIGRRSVRRVRH